MHGSDHHQTPLHIELVIQDACPLCCVVETELAAFSSRRRNISFSTVNLDHEMNGSSSRFTHIVPAVWVNGVLWTLGEVNMSTFEKRIDSLLKNILLNKQMEETKWKH